MMEVQASPEPAKLRAIVYRASFKDFIEAAWPHVDATPYQHSRYIEVLASHCQWVFETGETLVVNIPPRMGKSMIFSVMFNAWVWAKSPGMSFLSSTHSNSLTVRDARLTRQLVSCDWYVQHFGDLGFSADQNTKSKYINSSLGSRQSVSVGGKVTGDGAHIRLADDLLDASEARSERAIANVNSYLDDTFSTRFIDISYSPLILVMQRLATNDASGHLLKQGAYLLCLPMEYDPEHPNLSTTPAEAWPEGLDGDWREKGELLCPERFSEDSVQKLKLILGSSQSGQLNQYPTIENGDIITDSEIGYYDEVGGFKKIIITCDTAEKTGKNNAYSVFSMYGVKHDDPSLYVLDVKRGRYGIVELFVEATAFWNKHSSLPYQDNPSFSGFFIEEKSTGGPLITMMRRKGMGVESIERSVKSKKKLGGGKEVEVKQAKKKDERLDEVVVNLKLNQGKIMLPSCATYYTDAMWVDSFLTEIKSRQRMRPDLGYWDQADTLSDAGFKLLLQAKPKNPLAGLYGRK